MAILSMFRRSNSGDQSDNSNNNGSRRRRWWFQGRGSGRGNTCLQILCNMRLAVVILNMFNIGLIMFLLATGVSLWENEWGHLVPSCLLSMFGIMGALRVNLTLTYMSTIGFAILAFIYGIVFYVTGVVVNCVIVLTQMLLICDMMEGIVTKQDDALLAKDGHDVIPGFGGNDV
jgi:hypothetical protein